MIKEDSMMSPLPEKSEPFAGLQKVNIYISIYERLVKALALGSSCIDNLCRENSRYG